MDKAEAAIDYLIINTTKPPLNNPKVRKAFNLSIDKEAYANWRRIVKPLTAFTPEGMFPGYPQPKGAAFNPAEARRLLGEAGYPVDSKRDGSFSCPKFPVDQVEFIYNTQAANKAVAEWMQAQWKQNLGITVGLRNMEWKTFLEAKAKLEFKGFMRGAWGADYMDPFTFLSLFYTGGREWHRLAGSEIRRDARRSESHARSPEALRVAGESGSLHARRSADHSARYTVRELAEETIRERHVSESGFIVSLEVCLHRTRSGQVGLRHAEFDRRIMRQRGSENNECFVSLSDVS